MIVAEALVLMKTAASFQYWNLVLWWDEHFEPQVFCKNDSNKDGGGSAAPCESFIRPHSTESSGDLNPDCVLSACATLPSAGYLYGSAWRSSRDSEVLIVLTHKMQFKFVNNFILQHDFDAFAQRMN